MNNIDAHEAIGYVEKIIDNVRCPKCHKLEGSRVRYSCGHSACDECVIYAPACQTCTSSQVAGFQSKPDIPLTQTVKNAVDLLEACKVLSNTNEFQRKRKSEQLRIEKELFPNCIQAPVKYENKRKSSIKNKENRYSTFFPGEAITSTEHYKMDNTVTYVQQWLNKNETNLARKPFADLNINAQRLKNSTKKNIIQHLKESENIPQPTCRKRSHFKTINKVPLKQSLRRGNRLLVSDCDNTPKKIKKDSASNVGHISAHLIKKTCDNDESGIFLDDDTIVIDDSQEIDKDKNAWLAVLEAHKNNELESTSIVNIPKVSSTNNSFKQLKNSTASENKGTYNTKVPFYKKSAIIETCRYCKNEVNSVKLVPVTNKQHPVKITIDGDDYLTTITILKNSQDNAARNTSFNVSVQTDFCKANSDNISTKDCNFTNVNDCKEADGVFAVDNCDKQSEDLFADDRKIFGDNGQTSGIAKCIIVEASDSDTDLDISGPVSVTADVHRSCEELDYGVLSGIVNIKEHESKLRRGPRGHTPTSTDSSEKENYNPNRIKRRFIQKKKSTKK